MELVTDGLVAMHRIRVALAVPIGGVVARPGVLLHGPAGWGEYSPLPPPSGGRPGAEKREAARRAALEAACTGWPSPRRDRVPVSALVPAVEPEQAAALAADALARGVTSFKVKVGEGDHRGRVSAVRDTVGPGARVRVDANGAWDLDQAEAELAALARFDLELAEDPVASLDDLARLRRRVATPLAADAAVRSVEDARRLARLEAADAVVLKVQPLGGVRVALAVAEAAGVPPVVGSALETSIGLAAGVALAAALPELPYASGLGTALLLDGDVVADPLVPEGGALTLRRPVPDPDLLTRYRWDRVEGGLSA